jgi:hypothetical protein
MGIIMGALGGLGAGMADVGKEFMHQGFEAQQQERRFAAAQQIEQMRMENERNMQRDRIDLETQMNKNLLLYKMDLDKQKRGEVSGVISNAIANAPEGEDQGKIVADALLKAGHVDAYKDVAAANNKEEANAIRAQATENQLRLGEANLAMRQQLGEQNLALRQQGVALTGALAEARLGLIKAQTDAAEARTSAQDSKKDRDRTTQLNAIFGAKDAAYENALKDPMIAMDPKAKSAVETEHANLTAKKAATLSIAEDANISVSSAYQLVDGVVNGTTPLVKKGDKIAIDLGNGVGLPLPPALSRFIEPPKPKAAPAPAKPKPAAVPAPAPASRPLGGILAPFIRDNRDNEPEEFMQ